jgi:hypothetical protein
VRATDWDHQLTSVRSPVCRFLFLSFPPALSSSQQNQLDLSEALGIPLNNETPAVRDPSEHPKANASTYHPPQSAVWNNAGKTRSNAQNGVKEIQQIGGGQTTRRAALAAERNQPASQPTHCRAQPPKPATHPPLLSARLGLFVSFSRSLWSVPPLSSGRSGAHTAASASPSPRPLFPSPITRPLSSPVPFGLQH